MAKKQIAAAVEIADEQVPDFSVVERRIKYGDAAALTGPAIELINQPEPMTLYWGNNNREGRHFQLTKRKGWIPVQITELANAMDVGGDIQASPDGIVTRGEKGREALYKMPSRLFDLVAKRKVDDNLRRSRSAAHLKEGTQSAMVKNAESGQVGGRQRDAMLRGADRMHRMTVDLDESTERVEIDQ